MFGTEIKKLRLKAGLNLGDVASGVSVTRQCVTNWETGVNYPSVKKLDTLAKVLRTTKDELVEMLMSDPDYDKDKAEIAASKTFTIGQKIYYFRRKMDMEQGKLAEMLGCARQALSRWENDRQYPAASYIPKIANIFGIDESTLIDENIPPEPDMALFGNPDREEVIPETAPAPAPSVFEADTKGVLVVPVIDVYGEDTGDTVAVTDRRIVSSYTAEQLCAVTVFGDSMEPMIKNDDIVIFAKDSSPKPGTVSVVNLNGAYHVKGIRMDVSGNVILHSVNPVYQDISVAGYDFSVVGRALLIMSIRRPAPVF